VKKILRKKNTISSLKTEYLVAPLPENHLPGIAEITSLRLYIFFTDTL
jgi:hypothetical protein